MTWRIVRNYEHAGGVGHIYTNGAFLRERTACRLERIERERPATGGVNNKVCCQCIVWTSTISQPHGANGTILICRNQSGNPALISQRDVRAFEKLCRTVYSTSDRDME